MNRYQDPTYSKRGDPGREIARAVADADADASALASRFAERAADAGLIDVAYASVDSPFGPLMIAATPRGLVSVGLPNLDPERFLATLTERISPRAL
jgi:methylated-DNA-[protein]-cysteine S-methyltransferase